MKDNDAGSCQAGLVPTSNTTCYAIGGVNSYKSEYGLITQYDAT